MSGMAPEDVYELTGAGDPRISPDGRAVAFTVWSLDRESNEYRMAVWLAPLDGSGPPRQFTSGRKQDAEPRWSPDGSRLAFVSNRESEKKQLYVIPIAGGEPQRLTDLEEDVSRVVWSPDGTRLAFSSRVPDPGYKEEDDRKRGPRRFTRLQFKLDNVGWTGDRRQHLFVVPVDGSGEPEQITHGDFEDGEPAWSPDGARIAFTSARHEDWDTEPIRDLYVVEPGHEPVVLTKSDGYCEAPSWSPDGARIAYRYAPGRWDLPRHGQIGVLDIESGDSRVLTASLDRNCSPYPEIREPLWDGDRIVFALEDRGNTHVYSVAGDGSEAPTPLIDGELWVTGYDVVAKEMVHTATTATTFPELYRGSQRLTQVGDAFADKHEIIAPERFTATAPDGAEVDAWIMRPAGFEPGRRYPVLFNIHGGPFTQYGNRFFDEFQIYAAAGFVVLYSNPRGSSGYTEEWGRAIRGPAEGGPGMGTVDYDDLMAVVDEALRRFDFCDPDALGVMGGSYGGFMTSWIVGRTDRFKAACSERAVNNWVSDWGSSDLGWMFKGYIGAFLFESPDAYEQISPTTSAPNIRTPLLIMHSENDLRCDIEQAEHLFTILRLLKRPVEFVRFPAEGHELSRSGSPAHRVMRFDILLDWFTRHLRASGASVPG